MPLHQQSAIISATTIHTYTNAPLLTTLRPGLPGWAGARKVKPIWILLKQETVSGSGISWAIWKSAPRCRQITTPVHHYSGFTGQMPFLPPNQRHQSTEGKLLLQQLHSNHSSPITAFSSCISTIPVFLPRPAKFIRPATALACAVVHYPSRTVRLILNTNVPQITNLHNRAHTYSVCQVSTVLFLAKNMRMYRCAESPSYLSFGLLTCRRPIMDFSDVERWKHFTYTACTDRHATDNPIYASNIHWHG